MLYNIATCAEGTICKNNFHTIEILVGKCYDHAFSAFLLISHGFYDSSDVHVRSLAEMNNLLLLFLLKPEIYKEYYKTKPEEFSTKYASSKIRKILKKHIKEKGLGIDLPIDNIAYRNLSSYIHTEWKIPNKYSSCERGRIGGIYQQAGFKNKIQILLEHATYTIIFAIKLTNRTDLKHKFERIFIKEQECK
ncbi:MAG: hypothetical protein HAW60_06020 [Bdellovibrionales bacterium]|nr:hypothetical protein [Bdellovibrionales bacterium]